MNADTINILCAWIRVSLVVLGAGLLIFACSDDDASTPKAPVISSFNPTSALPGATVTISGANFNASTAGNIVAFDNIPAVVTSATATEIHAVVPPAATTGKISVITNGKSATSSADFTVLETTITGFTPSSGVIGTSVTINGNNFHLSPAGNIVKFNGVSAVVSSGNSTQLTVVVPPAATTGKVSVTIDGNTSTSSSDFTVLQTTITDFSPTSGVAGTSVTINGTNFSDVAAQNVVKFNGVAATVSSATSTQLTVTVPSEATTGEISITIHDVNITSATDFTILQPTIQSYSPQIGSPGRSIVITGTNFSTVLSNNVVEFNGTEATVTAATATTLTVTVPEGATTGELSVTVGPNTATSSSNFEVCTGAAELVISDVVIVNTSGATSYTVSFKITNVGSVDADVSDMSMQNYALQDQAGTGEVAASGYSLTAGPVLAPGESYTTPNYSCNISGQNTTTRPYLKLTLYGTVSECNTANNIFIKRFGL
jgi:hypothetical protein